jgi:NAD(P)-dependent dehydrogenase (short-subunit alcohol dehydrogenase family)
MNKGAQAKQEIEKELPDAHLTLLKLDLSDLDSIESFVAQFEELNVPLHILINNAGVMAIPYRETANKFEMQFGVCFFLKVNFVRQQLIRY